jgi:predicted acyltransferase
MTVADVVFPAFLFIVGMSMPFALARRRAAGDGPWQLAQHIVARALGLLVLGVFMVNAESGFNEAAMGMSIHVWSLMVYGAALLTWGGRALAPRVAGALALLVLAFLYRGGTAGTEHLTPQWWGILGLIGWAYLIASALYLHARARTPALAAAVAACIAFYCLSQAVAPGPLAGQAGNAVHAAIVLCGALTSRIFFEGGQRHGTTRRYRNALLLATGLLACGAVLRPCFHISKIAATPTWAFYSAAICVMAFGCLYWLVDLRGIRRWTSVLQPAAAQPLLAYIVPYIVYALTQYFHLTLPAAFNAGAPGMLAAFAYACAVVASIPALNRVGIKLHL